MPQFMVVNHVIATAVKGARYEDAVREALVLSLNEQRPVQLFWGGSSKMIDGNLIVGRLCNEPLSKPNEKES